MAPRKKVNTQVDATIEMTSDMASLLHDIVASTNTKGYAYYNPTDLNDLVSSNLVEVNFNMVNPKNAKQYACRSTEKGNNFIMAKKSAVNEVMVAPVQGFSVGTFDRAAVKPKVAAGKRGRESKYHLDKLEAGQFVFVPVSDKHATGEELAKSLAGTVQAANKKFAEATGETKVISRKVKGSDEKTEKQVAVTRLTRKYAVYPYINNGVDGAALVREM